MAVVRKTAGIGKGTPGPGRPKGLPNQATANAREAIARFVDGNASRCQGWLDQIAKQQGPMAAYKAYLDMVEYHVPKLARTEHTGADGAPLQVVVQKMTLSDEPWDGTDGK